MATTPGPRNSPDGSAPSWTTASTRRSRCSPSRYRRTQRPADPWRRPAVIDDLKAEARSRGLWNLFLAHHPEGAGLTNLQYAPLAEITGRSPALAPGGPELRRAGHRQHGGAGRVRLGRAAGALAAPAARRRDQVGVLHDRAGRGVLGRDQHRHQDRPGRRRLRDQRPEVVVVRGDGPRLRDPHRDGPDRLGRGPAPAAVHDPGAQGHPGRHGQARHQRVRLRRRAARRPRRGRVHATSGCRPPT